MHSNIFSTLIDFRHKLYACFVKAGDVLMNTVDALLSHTDAQSLVELSLSPAFERRWSSLYDAFDNANIDREALRKLFMNSLPKTALGQRRVFGVDASSIPRPLSKTARDRTYVHASNLPEGTKPVTPGWQFSTIALLPEKPSSWTAPVDSLRIPSDKTQGEVAHQQLKALAPLLNESDLLLEAWPKNRLPNNTFANPDAISCALCLDSDRQRGLTPRIRPPFSVRRPLRSVYGCNRADSPPPKDAQVMPSGRSGSIFNSDSR